MKTYIGQGKRNEKFNTIIDVVIDMNKAQGFLFEGEKGTYLRFSVGERKAVDEFGNTHTVSVWQPDMPAADAGAQPAPTEAPAAVSEPAPEVPAEKKRKSKKG